MGATRRVGRVAKPVPAIVLSPLEQEIITARCRQLLFYLRRGKPVEKIRVHLTHANIHAIHASQAPHARQMREQYPLEIVLAEGADMEQRHDTSGFTVAWDIDLPTVPARTRPAAVNASPVEVEFQLSPKGQHEPT